VAELPAVKITDGLIEAGEKVEPLRGNASKDAAPVRVLPASLDQPALFEAAEQAGNVRLAGDHAVPDFAAKQALLRSPKDAKNIVLVRREPVFAEKLGGTAGEQVGGPLEFQEEILFRAGGTGTVGTVGWSHTLKDGRWNRYVSKTSYSPKVPVP
jgi:hypothetical protein